VNRGLACTILRALKRIPTDKLISKQVKVDQLSKNGHWPCSGHGIQENGSGLYLLAAHAVVVWLFLIHSIKSQGNGYTSVNSSRCKNPNYI